MRRKAKRIRKDVLFLITLVLVFLSFNYPAFDDRLNDFLGSKEEIYVSRIIDGDTLESNKTSVRLLGINTPERGEVFYSEAKAFLSEAVLNKTVSLEFVGPRKDKYQRTLAYVFFEGENVNVKMVENGYANYYFYDGMDKYSEALISAWNICIEREVNLCEVSRDPCGSCVNIEGQDSMINNCGFSCDISGWEVKGEGRDKFIFGNQTLNPGKIVNFAVNTQNSGGTIFLRDSEGKLVGWKRFD